MRAATLLHMREGISNQERFTRSSARRGDGSSVERELTGEGSRRDVLFAFLQGASRDPEVLVNGLDMEELNAVLRAADAGTADYSPDRNVGLRSFTTAFHPDITYAPLAAIERAEEEELSPELRAARAFMEFLRRFLRERGQRYGAELCAPESERVIIGFSRRHTDGDAPIIGGFHAGLNEQGYKYYDATLQENIRMDTDETPEYRVADLLRSLAHDSVHAAQLKIFGSASSRIAHFERRRVEMRKRHERQRAAVRDPESALPAEVAEAQERARRRAERGLQRLLDRARHVATVSDAQLLQYGSILMGMDDPVTINGEQTPLPLGAALFEYTSDRVGREAVTAYHAARGTGLPEPANELERLSRMDLEGKRIAPEDVRWEELSGNARKAAEEMVKYHKSIVAPVEHVAHLFGALADDFEGALEEAVLTGKFRKMARLRERMQELDPAVLEELRGFAATGAVVMRPLFAGAGRES